MENNYTTLHNNVVPDRSTWDHTQTLIARWMELETEAKLIDELKHRYARHLEEFREDFPRRGDICNFTRGNGETGTLIAAAWDDDRYL